MVDGIGNVRGPLTAVKRTSNALKAFQRSELGSVTRFETLLRRTTNLTWQNANDIALVPVNKAKRTREPAAIAFKQV